MNSNLKELKYSNVGEEVISWLRIFNGPILIFVLSEWHKPTQCQAMKRMLREISRQPNFKDQIMFRWFSADKNAKYCKQLLVGHTPVALIFKNGKEVAKFRDPSSKEAIMHNLEILIDPARNHAPQTQ